MSYSELLAKAFETFHKGGPYVGPRGGKYSDPQHKIPWKEKTEGKSWGEKHGNAAEEAPTKNEAIRGLKKLQAIISNADSATDAQDLKAVHDTFLNEMKQGASPGSFSKKLKGMVGKLDTAIRDEIPSGVFWSLFPEKL